MKKLFSEFYLILCNFLYLVFPINQIFEIEINSENEPPNIRQYISEFTEEMVKK